MLCYLWKCFLSSNVMFTCNKHHQLLWMWLYDTSFCKYERCYLLKFYYWKAEMIKLINNTNHLPHVDGQVDLSFVIILAKLRCKLHVQSIGAIIMLICNLQSMSLSRLAYGLSHATVGRNIGWKMVLPLVH